MLRQMAAEGDELFKKDDLRNVLAELLGAADASRTREADEFYANKLVAEAFAAFLRAHGGLWRLRRHDRFAPVDFHLAERQVTLQARIDRWLLSRFRDSNGSFSEIANWEISHGDELTFYLPAMSQRKELLTDFSVRDEGGKAVPILTRMESSQISAAVALTDLAKGVHEDEQRAFSSNEVWAATFVLTALAYQDPGALCDRIKDWTQSRGFEFKKEGPLREEVFTDWIYAEGEIFRGSVIPVDSEADEAAPSFGDLLLEELKELIRSEDGGAGQVPIPQNLRDDRQGLQHFPTLSSLLVHSVRDLLRIAIELRPAWPESASNSAAETKAPNHDAAEVYKESAEETRADLLNDPALLAKRVTGDLTEGLKVLDELVKSQASARGVLERNPTEELFGLLTRWTVYVVPTVRLGVPFLIKMTETLSLGRPQWLRDLAKIFRTKIYLPIAYKDAQALHVEVALRDPEIVLGRSLDVVREKAREPVFDYFGTLFRESPQVVQVYSSRREGEARDRDVRAGRLFLRIRLRLRTSIRLGYALTGASLIAAATYLSVVWWRLLSRGEALDVEAVATVSAVSVTITLWLTNIQHRRPVVHKKLIFWRMIFVVTIAAILAWPAYHGLRLIGFDLPP